MSIVRIDRLSVNADLDHTDWINSVCQPLSSDINLLVLLREQGRFDLDLTWNHLRIFATKIKNKPVVFILNSWWKPYADIISDIFFAPIHFMDYFLVETWYNANVRKILPISQKWNPDNTKFLFFTGINHRLNRTRLLNKFQVAGLLDHSIWSWFLADNAGNSFLPELSNDQYLKFVNSVLHSPDSSFKNLKNGSPTYSAGIFDNSLFQVISETDFDGLVYDENSWITEKTWKCILNRLPFIMAGNHFTLKKLSNMGFFTFNEFLKIHNYDDPSKSDYLDNLETTIPNWNDFYQSIADISWPACPTQKDLKLLPPYIQEEILTNHIVTTVESDKERRLNAIVINTQYFLDNLKKHTSEITLMIDHNFNHLSYLAKKNIKEYEHWANKNGVSIPIENLIFNPCEN